MAELTRQEKRVLEGKLRKATKELVKAGYSKKDVKDFDSKFEEISDEKKMQLLLANGNEFVELMKEIVSGANEEVEEAQAQEEAAPVEEQQEVAQEETPVEETVQEEVQAEEVVQEEAQAEEQAEEVVQEEAQVEETVQEEVEEQAAQEETPVEVVEEQQAEEAVQEEVKAEVVEEEQAAQEETPVEVVEEQQTEEAVQEEVKAEEEQVEKTEEEKKNDEFLEQAKEIVGEDFISNPEPKVDPDYEGPEEELTPEQSEELEKAEKAKSKKQAKKAPVKKTSDDEDDEEEDDDEDTEEEAASEGYNKKVLLKLKTSCDRTQKYYSDLRNELRCYKALKFKSNNTGDTYSYKNKVVFKVTVFPKALKIYFALKPADYQVSKYHHKDVKDIKKYESIPLMLRVSSDRSYKYALELLAELATKLKLTKSNVKAIDFMPDFETTSKALLIEQGGEEILRASCTKDHSTCISDGLAKKCMMLRCRGAVEGEKNVCEISIGELSAAFKTSYVITLDLLKKVGLADKNANYLKVTAMNNCYKAITIFADEYEPEVIRMVVSTGGNITKLVK